ncbi:MAG: SDR family oxidoreductase [Myxococcota bacterium]|jgi:NAD(P)-dependent dehydrogenase (short-subunit alcohol dehydrogenase family)|nr:SDR family oxidoreductase [Myxococcota bacterium]
MQIQDKTIVVTGAASGIGRALARRFDAEGAKHIVCVDLDAEGAGATAKEVGGTAMTANVAVEDDIARVIATTESEVGPIDLFCSNAGIGLAPELASANDEWQMSWDVNVMAHVYAARHLVPRMIERGGGYFMHTASAAGLLNQIGGAAYGVTKHAAVGFGEWLALTYQHQGIRVSMLCPQAVRTPMTENDTASTAAAAGDGMMEPEELAECVIAGLAAESFLILPHAEVSKYMKRKTADYDRWIGGMNRLHQRLTGA